MTVMRERFTIKFPDGWKGRIQDAATRQELDAASYIRRIVMLEVEEDERRLRASMDIWLED